MISVQCSVFGALYGLNGHEHEAQMSEDDIVRQATAFYTTGFSLKFGNLPKKMVKPILKKLWADISFNFAI